VKSIGKTENNREVMYIHFGSAKGVKLTSAQSVLIIGGFDGAKTTPPLLLDLAT
jgi:hypothetical protein